MLKASELLFQKSAQKYLIIFLSTLLIAGCAGTTGRPELVNKLLSDRYVGRDVDFAVLELGVPDLIIKMDSGRQAYTWRRESAKYRQNLFVKSDERCVVTLLTGTDGSKVELVGKVDDSLGAWQLSYCAEQLGL